jgi:alkanesulfonate monooxygenase SsuD/methylene tetrahydromethanopterin reductase-like flavin-dependent oxidoreductase (luciferase family)
MIPQFNPGPIEHPRIPIHVAAVNRYMCQVAGEVSDGVRAHPICTRKYMQEVMLPAVRQGALKAGRPATDIAVCGSPLLIAAADEAGLEERMRNVRARIAFYASTPTYRRCLIYTAGEMWHENLRCCPNNNAGKKCLPMSPTTCWKRLRSLAHTITLPNASGSVIVALPPMSNLASRCETVPIVNGCRRSSVISSNAEDV